MLDLGLFALGQAGLAEVDLILQLERAPLFLHPDHPPTAAKAATDLSIIAEKNSPGSMSDLLSCTTSWTRL